MLAIIPARKGSKRLPGKNIKILNGHPLIAYSLRTALSSKLIDKVVVSTDSNEIARISKEYGAHVPFLRPRELSTDNSSSFDVYNHAIQSCSEIYNMKIHEFVVLQPTSPFRRLKTIKEGIRIFKKNKHCSVIGAEQCKYNSDNMYFKSTERKYKSLKKLFKKTTNIYRTNGSYFLTSPYGLRKNKSFYSNNTFPLVCKLMIESIDIDTIDDWKIAKKLVNFKFN